MSVESPQGDVVTTRSAVKSYEKLELLRTQWLTAYVYEMDKGKEFYKAVFGLQEIRHFSYTNPDRTSATLQFGNSVAEGLEQTGSALGVAYREAGQAADPIARLILNVTQIETLKSLIVQHGGQIISGPSVNACGVAVTLFMDPVGNKVELRSLSPGRTIKHRRPSAEVAGMRITVTKANCDATLRYYRELFNLHEVARSADGLEIVLQEGRTPEEARNGTGTQLVLLTVDKFIRPSVYEPIASQIVLSVGANMDELLRRCSELGGAMYQPATVMPTGNIVGRIKDPSGNIMELLRPPGYDG